MSQSSQRKHTNKKRKTGSESQPTMNYASQIDEKLDGHRYLGENQELKVSYVPNPITARNQILNGLSNVDRYTGLEN